MVMDTAKNSWQMVNTLSGVEMILWDSDMMLLLTVTMLQNLSQAF